MSQIVVKFIATVCSSCFVLSRISALKEITNALGTETETNPRVRGMNLCNTQIKCGFCRFILLSVLCKHFA